MEFYLAHVGINPVNEEEITEMMNLIALLFPNEAVRENPLSWFVADGKIEMMKEPGYGSKGHLAFYTSDIHQTMEMMEQKGFRFDWDSAKYEDDGSLRLIYIDKEINGFAIHLTTKK